MSHGQENEFPISAILTSATLSDTENSVLTFKEFPSFFIFEV